MHRLKRPNFQIGKLQDHLQFAMFTKMLGPVYSYRIQLHILCTYPLQELTINFCSDVIFRFCYRKESRNFYGSKLIF